jgi:hypothetical protein
MPVTTIKITELVSPAIEDLVENKIYNLLVKQRNKLVDIRCRIISKSENRILIFKL